MLAAMSRPDYYGNRGGLTSDVEVVRAVYDAFARRDVDDMLRHIASTCELHLVATAAASGRSEPYRDRSPGCASTSPRSRRSDDLVLHADDVRVIPGSVIVIGYAAGHRGGTPVRRAAVWTWQVSDRLVNLGRASTLRPAAAALNRRSRDPAAPSQSIPTPRRLTTPRRRAPTRSLQSNRSPPAPSGPRYSARVALRCERGHAPGQALHALQGLRAAIDKSNVEDVGEDLPGRFADVRGVPSSTGGPITGQEASWTVSP